MATEQPTPPQDAAAPADATKVFVSYSRRDLEFVSKLVDALKEHGDFHVFQDTSDILPSEEWKARLEKLIGEADTIVFCMSPNSIASEVCSWEVELAESLNKRIVPVVIQEMQTEVPDGLAKLNYTFFTDASGFGQSFEKLVTALQTDIAWIRDHTRIGELARRWQSSKRRDELIRGAALHDAEQWAKYRPSVAPELTENMLAYLKASRDEVTAARWRLRRNIGLVGFLFFMGAMSWLFQDLLAQKFYWWTKVRPYVLKAEAETILGKGQSFKECADCPVMVVIPAGKFKMGEKREKRQQTITRRFAVSKFEITFAQWDVCFAQGGCLNRANDLNWGRENRPAINVSWHDAKEYVTWISKLTGQEYRLLSDAEWEYSARAGSSYTWFSWGDEIGKGNAACAGCGNQWDGKKTEPVGSFKPNAFGLYDMHGNASEWVQDCYGDAKNARTDGSAKEQKSGNDLKAKCLRVLRGGSWGHIPLNLRSAVRDLADPAVRYNYMGFRLARTLIPPTP